MRGLGFSCWIEAQDHNDGGMSTFKVGGRKKVVVAARGDKMKCLEECFGSQSPKDRERYRVSIDLGTLVSCAIGPLGELCKKDMAFSSSIYS